MEALVVSVAVVAMVALVASIIQTSQLTFLAVREPGIGRIIFVTLATLKFWCSLTLGYFLVNTFDPHAFGDADDYHLRLGIRLFLGVYLLVQPLAVNIALYRWRHKE